MSLELVRVDDRLIHGQVTVAWGSWLSPDRIVLANDEVAASPWRREMYSSTDSMGVAVTVVAVDEFVGCMSDGVWDDERVLLVVESPADLLRVVRGGVAVPDANIGGMHHAPGKRELLPYLYVNDDDVRALRELESLGVRLEARDVPQARPVDVGALLGGE